MKLSFLKSNLLNWVAGAICAVCAVILVMILVKQFDQSRIDPSFYQLSSNQVTGSVRIVALSDLHNREFGDQNSDLVDKVKSLQPDIIAILGDMTISDGKYDYSVILSLCEKLKEIAPVYYGWGNHEYRDMLVEGNYTLKSALEKLGVHLVNNTLVQAEVKGNIFSIGGICTTPEYFYDNADAFLQKYEKEAKGFKLLFSHRPSVFERVMEPYPVDLALCGDTHGGQIILPLLGGLYTPDEGLFPDVTYGKYQMSGSTVIVSRGLGSSSWVPRFGNPPEIAVVDIN